MTEYLESLKPYCKTSTQSRILQEVINTNGNMQKASANLGLNKGAAQKTVARIKKYASQQGYAPEADLYNPVAPTQQLSGVSTLYDDSGNVKLQWVKSNAKAESILEALTEIADELNQTIESLDYTPPKPAVSNDLLNMYVLTDYHLGMFTDENISDDKWDIEIAEKFILNWFKYAIDNSPKAEVGLLLNLGDFFHSDSIDPVTPASKHLLDVGVSYHEIVRTGIRIIKQIIEMMRTKYSTVLLYNVAGNHDTTSTIWLKEFFSSYYELCDDVIVSTDQRLYNCYVHGNTSLFFTHGHKKKINNLQDTLVSLFRKEYGQTTKSYAHTGHYHHSQVKEHNSMVIQQHRTMTAPDAYSSNGGYKSGRSADIITYHKEFGEVSKLTVSSDLINTMAS